MLSSLLNSVLMKKIDTLLTTLWVGSLWAIGYLAVPILFYSLDDRMLAGMLAGKMFTLVSYIGLGCGALLLTLTLTASPSVWRARRRWLLVMMLGLVIAGEFVLQPMMAELKIGGLVVGSEQAASFARLHGIASILYMINSLAGAVLVASTRPVEA
jgi:hypothetical protein